MFKLTPSSARLCNALQNPDSETPVIRTMTRPVVIYGAETWTLRRSEEELVERTELRILRWILGFTLKDMKRNDDIRRIGQGT